METFRFLDIPYPPIGNYKECHDSQQLNIRGANYLQDKLKIHGGVPKMKFLLFEIFAVDMEKHNTEYTSKPKTLAYCSWEILYNRPRRDKGNSS